MARDPNRDARSRIRIVLMGLGALFLGSGIGMLFDNSDAGWLIGGGLFLVLLGVVGDDL